MADAALLEVDRLTKTFSRRRGGGVAAVRGVSFSLRRGESLGLVGESGSGKTTIARILMGLETATSGSVRIAGRPVERSLRGAHARDRARAIQMVFQDPYTSLDPRQRVGDGIDEIQRLHFARSAPERRRRTAALLEAVGLGERDAAAVPHALSGGQRQRVAIARALASEPSVLVLDEAVSALDVSTQAQVLNLLAELRARLDLAYLAISHDLAVVRQVADRCLVLYRGTAVEGGTVERILSEPRHPYTQQLIASIPRPGRPFLLSPRERVVLAGDGCVFRGRCPRQFDRCRDEPQLVEVSPGHTAACWWSPAGEPEELMPAS